MRRVLLGLALVSAMGIGLVAGLLLAPVRAAGENANPNAIDTRRFTVEYGTIGARNVAIRLDRDTGDTWILTNPDTPRWITIYR